MKYIISILLMVFSITAIAQTAAPNRGTYGTQSNFFSTKMNNLGINTANGAILTPKWGQDTLTNGDTGYAYIWIGESFQTGFELVSTTLTGTVASTAIVLYGVNNAGSALTPAGVITAIQTPSTNAYALTGNTTYCTTCIGASSTTVPGAAKKYTWLFPNNAPMLFDNYVIRVIQTGTCTTTYKGRLTTQY